MDDIIKRPDFTKKSTSSWGAVASDYPDLIKKQYNVGETEQKGTIDNIINLFKERYSIKTLRQHLAASKSL